MTDVAVILLPGILASPLTNERNEDVWPVHKDLATFGTILRDTKTKLKLFARDWPNDESNATRVLRPTTWRAGDVDFAASVYHKFVKLAPADRQRINGQQLTFTPHMFVLNYNWSVSTLDNLFDVAMETHAIMNTTLANGSKPTKFMYVTHSMGGLVALATALKYPTLSSTDFLGIVAVAGPLLGAPEALMRMVRGFPYADDVLVKYSLDWLIAKLLTNKGWKFSMLAPIMPGFADLLPFDVLNRNLAQEVEDLIRFHFDDNRPIRRSSRHASAPLSSTRSVSWSEANQRKETLVAAMRRNTRSAHLLHTFIRNNISKLQVKGKLVNVFLSGKDTVDAMGTINLAAINDLRGSRTGRLAIPDVLTAGTDYKISDAGDGTVPVGSQKFGFDFNFTQLIKAPDGIKHADAFNAPMFEPGPAWGHIHSGMNWLASGQL